jgi:hypothetical protein
MCTCITLTRIAMDEIEFRRLYNEACNYVGKVTAPDTKASLFTILQLIDGMRQQIEELQVEEDC